MEFEEKAKIRIEHWLHHNEDHIHEYGRFMEELDAAGNNDAAAHMRDMISHAAKSNDYLRLALLSLDPMP